MPLLSSDNYSNFPHFHAINMAVKILENTQWNSLTRCNWRLLHFCLFSSAKNGKMGRFSLFFFLRGETVTNDGKGGGKILPV